MVAFIILLACMFAGVALHLYQMLSLLAWIGRRAECGDRCGTVASAPGPAPAVVSLSAEPPDSMREICMSSMCIAHELPEETTRPRTRVVD